VGGGELGGMLTVLAPATDGGTLAGIAESYNAVATALAEMVNAQHRQGETATGQPGGDFFTLSTTGPAALGLELALSDASDLALAQAGGGPRDSGNANALSEIGRNALSPDARWTEAVGAFAVRTAGDIQRAQLSDAAAVTAVTAQRSVAAVDGDEETI